MTGAGGDQRRESNRNEDPRHPTPPGLSITKVRGVELGETGSAVGDLDGREDHPTVENGPECSSSEDERHRLPRFRSR